MAVLEMIEMMTSIKFGDAQKIFKVDFNVEYISILRTTPAPKLLNAIIIPWKQRDPEALSKEKLQKNVLILSRKSLFYLQLRMFCLFLYFFSFSFLSPCPLFLSSLFIYLFSDWVGRKKHCFGRELFLSCSLFMVILIHHDKLN